MARALRDLRGGLAGFDTDLSGLATTKKWRLPCYEEPPQKKTHCPLPYINH
jgi:hypothetical protein